MVTPDDWTPEKPPRRSVPEAIDDFLDDNPVVSTLPGWMLRILVAVMLLVPSAYCGFMPAVEIALYPGGSCDASVSWWSAFPFGVGGLCVIFLAARVVKLVPERFSSGWFAVAAIVLAIGGVFGGLSVMAVANCFYSN